MTFRDLDEFFDDSLRLPIGGKEYVVPSPNAETGLWCQGMLAAGVAVHAGRQPEGIAELDDEQENNLYQRVLGPVWGELQADGVPWTRIRHAGITAFLWAAGNEDLASAFWESGGRGEAPAPNRKARRTASTASATSTRSRGSTNGTTSASTRRTAANGSRGATSSRTGR